MSNRRYHISKKIEEIDYGKLLFFSYSIYEGEWHSIPHSHFISEVFFITKGEGIFHVENKKIKVKEKDIIAINPNVTHSEISNKNNRLEYYVLGISDIIFDFGENEYTLCDFSKEENSVLFLLEKINLEFHDEKENFQNVIQETYKVLFLEFLRISGYKHKKSLNKKISKECYAIKKYIDGNFNNNITLENLGELFHINKFYLAHQFVEAYNISPINYLIDVRINASKELLVSADYNISEVAVSCGFSSQSYFSQSFKKKVGITPINYRKENKKNL